MSPEVVSNATYSHDADLWALGVIIFEMLTGFVPFCRDDDLDDGYQKTKQAIRRAEYQWPELPIVSPEAKDLVDGLLKSRVDDRLILERLFVHKWIVKHVKRGVN